MTEYSEILNILFEKKILNHQSIKIAEKYKVSRNTVGNICNRYKLSHNRIKTLHARLSNEEIDNHYLEKYFRKKRKGGLSNKDRAFIKECCLRKLYCYQSVKIYCEKLIEINNNNYKNRLLKEEKANKDNIDSSKYKEEYDTCKLSIYDLLDYDDYLQEEKKLRSLNETEGDEYKICIKTIELIRKIWYKKALMKRGNYKEIFDFCSKNGISCSFKVFYNYARRFWDENAQPCWKEIKDSNTSICKYFVDHYFYNAMTLKIEEK